MKFEISRHARNEMNRRGISEDLVQAVLQNPGQIVDEYGNMKAYQAITGSETGKNYLVRVIVNDTVEPEKVVTVYKTSKIKKYWREP
jgi:ABC-type sugar transport system substrate-binding protein